jgi:hypothetical protein
MGVMPAAGAGVATGYFMAGVLMGLAGAFRVVGPPSDVGGNRLLRYVIWLFPMGALFVMAGALTAPRWRVASAAVLAVVWIGWTGKVHGWGYEAVAGAVIGSAAGVMFVGWAEHKRLHRQIVTSE